MSKDYFHDMLEGMEMERKITEWATSLPPSEDVIAIDFSMDIDKPSSYQTKDGRWHSGYLKGEE